MILDQNYVDIIKYEVLQIYKNKRHKIRMERVKNKTLPTG